MKKTAFRYPNHPLVSRDEKQSVRNEPEVIAYTLTPEEIAERYGHVKPYKKPAVYATTAPQSRGVGIHSVGRESEDKPIRTTFW